MYCDQCGHSEDQEKERAFGQPTPFINWIELIMHDRPHCKPAVSHRHFCKPGCLHKFLKLHMEDTDA